MNMATYDLKKSKVSLIGFCNEHKKPGETPETSRKFVGVQKNIDGDYYLTFFCSRAGGHTFNNIYPRDYPGPSASIEEFKAWMNGKLERQNYLPKR